MTSKIVATVATAAKDLPAGVTAVGLLCLSLIAADASVVSSVNVDGVSASFAGVPDGTYTVTAQRLDATNTTGVGDLVSSDPFVVATGAPAPTTFDAPASIAITVTPE